MSSETPQRQVQIKSPTKTPTRARTAHDVDDPMKNKTLKAADVDVRALRRIFENEDVAKLRKVFDKADESGNAAIDLAEWRKDYNSFFPDATDVTPEKMNEDFKKIDHNGTGEISWNKFITWIFLEYPDKYVPAPVIDAMNAEFKKLDENGDGIITKEEYLALFPSADWSLVESKFGAVDGRLTAKEFVLQGAFCFVTVNFILDKSDVEIPAEVMDLYQKIFAAYEADMAAKAGVAQPVASTESKKEGQTDKDGATQPLGSLKAPGTGPIELDLKDGPKWFCRCGQSQKFPLCDGSHKAQNAAHGTNYSPLKLDKDELGKDKVWICGCGKSKQRQDGKPFCDGSHKEVKGTVASAVRVDLEGTSSKCNCACGPRGCRAARARTSRRLLFATLATATALWTAGARAVNRK